MKKATLLLAASALFALSSCGGGAPAETFDYEGDILVWCAEAAQALTTSQGAKFLKDAGLDQKVKLTVAPVGEGDASSKMTTDVTAGADIYFFAQDQLASLRTAQALSSIGGKYKENIINNNGEVAVKAASLGDKVYAFPCTSDNGYYLYYNASKLGENDVKEWEKIIAKAEADKLEVDFNYTSAWYNFGFFYATGCDSVWETDKDGVFTDYTDTYNSDNGVKALKAMATIFGSSAVVDNSAAGGIGANCAALVSGTWDFKAMKEKWGDDLRCVELPTFTVGDQKIHTGSFSGMKFVGVKPQTDEKKVKLLYAIADYLTGEAGQAERFEKLQWGPSNKKVAASDAVKAAPQIAALAAQNVYSKPQGQFPKKWWDLAGALPKDAIDLRKNGDPADADYKRLLTVYAAAIEELKGSDEK